MDKIIYNDKILYHNCDIKIIHKLLNLYYENDFLIYDESWNRKQ